MTTILALVKSSKALAKLQKQLPAGIKLITAAEASAADLAQVTILLGWGPLGKEILELPESQLQWIQVISAGVDALPLTELKKRGILLSNTSGIHAQAIAESVLGMLLAHVRGLQTAINQQAQVHWQTLPHKQLTTLTGKKLLIYGTGHIGQRIAALAQALGMETVGVNRSGHAAAHFTATYSMATAQAAVQQADVIVNVMPLTATTNQFFNVDFFAQLQTQPIFINVGRGASVDTTALLRALQGGQISYAALDVVDPEPLPPTHPLWQQENLLLTPHISGIFDGYMQQVNQIFLPNLHQFLENGKLVQNQVDLTRGY